MCNGLSSESDGFKIGVYFSPCLSTVLIPLPSRFVTLKTGRFKVCKEPRASARGFFYRKSHSTWGLSALKPPWPFIPALPSGAFWLFHVIGKKWVIKVDIMSA
jgi:hypothetical protein